MTTTKELVKQLRAQNPVMKGADIARAVGRSRERVSQLLEKLGLPTRFSRARSCESCGELYYPTRVKSPLCAGCRRATKYTILMCAGPGCHVAFGRLTTLLEWERKHRPKLLGLYFHNKPCFGRYAAEHWGWGPQKRKKEQLSA